MVFFGYLRLRAVERGVHADTYLYIMTKIGIIAFFICLAHYGLAQQAPATMPTFSGIHDVYNPARKLQGALPTSGKVILIFYDPGCGHCQALGSGIARNAAKFAKASIFFISMNDKEYVDGYVNMFADGLKNKKNISFWKDEGVEFIEKFMPENYPATYIYDARTKKLIQSFQGEDEVVKIIPFL